MSKISGKSQIMQHRVRYAPFHIIYHKSIITRALKAYSSKIIPLRIILKTAQMNAFCNYKNRKHNTANV